MISIDCSQKQASDMQDQFLYFILNIEKKETILFVLITEECVDRYIFSRILAIFRLFSSFPESRHGLVF